MSVGTTRKLDGLPSLENQSQSPSTTKLDKLKPVSRISHSKTFNKKTVAKGTSLGPFTDLVVEDVQLPADLVVDV
jgi:hypothetical protein